MKYTTEEYSKLLDGRLPSSALEFELANRLIESFTREQVEELLAEQRRKLHVEHQMGQAWIPAW